MTISIRGTTSLLEGQEANYKVVLDGFILGVGDSIGFTLNVLPETAISGNDYSVIGGDLLIAPEGIGLVVVANLDGSFTVRLANNTTDPIGSGSTLLSFTLQAFADQFAELEETFIVRISGGSQPIVNGEVRTTIKNVGGIIVSTTDPSQWDALSGNTTVYEGIAALSEARRFTVETGDTNSSVFLSDAIAYATLNVGNGDNDISILVEPRRDDIQSYVQFGHGAYFARIIAGDGNDVVNIQSEDNVIFVRANPQSPPGYELSDYYQSIVDVGAGNDYVYAFLPFQSQFFGGDGVDTIFFYGRFSDWSYEVVDAIGNGSLDITLSDNALDYSVWTVGENISSTARNNRVQGFEFVQFNDILLKVREAIAITGPANIGEGSTAAYAISLAGDGLRSQQSVTLDLQVASLGATAGIDYTELATSFLRGAGTSVTLDVIAFDPVAQTLRAVVTANRDLATGTVIANLSIPTVNDLVVEGPERFSVTLSGFIDPVIVVTTIVDNDAAAITLSGLASVAEGATTTLYTVSLSGVGLGVGQSVTFTLDTASGSATEGIDFSALVEGSLDAAAGVTLSGVSTGAAGVITVTATNTSASDLATGAALLSFTIATTADVVVEANETFTVSLASSTAMVATGTVTTTIIDNDAAAITLSGPAAVLEGATTGAYAVALSGVALGVGQSLTFTLDSISQSAIEGVDFKALTNKSLNESAGVVLSGIVLGPNGSVTVTVTNISSGPLLSGTQLLSFALDTIDNNVIELSRAEAVSSMAISGGVYLAGVDIAAGTYRGVLAGNIPYWQISDDANGSNILANDIPSGPFFVSIVDGQYLSLRDVEVSLDSGLSAPDAENGLPLFEVVLASAIGVVNGSVKTVIIDNDSLPGVNVTDATPTGGRVITAALSAGDVDLVGTSNADVITGNYGANKIYGGLGADVMAGLFGADTFQFRLSDGLSQGDQIIDFDPSEDKIQLSDVPRGSRLAKLFKGQAEISGKKSSKVFAVVESERMAANSKRQFVYDRTSGALYYNENGKKGGFGSGGQIATLPILIDFQASNITLHYNDQAF